MPATTNDRSDRRVDEGKAIARLKAGDIRGLETLVEAYYTRAMRAAYLVTHDQALAEDVVQSAFIRAYERIASFDATRPFGPWFLRSVVNGAATQAAARARVVALDADDPAAAASRANLAIEPGLRPEELLEQAETREEVWRALDQLPPPQRAAIVMHYYLGLPDAETAEQLGVPPATVRWRLHAARKRLRQLLGGVVPAGQGDPPIAERALKRSKRR
jgi:RNA polymerase sigma-70 factor (ECF subfamily)